MFLIGFSIFTGFSRQRNTHPFGMLKISMAAFTTSIDKTRTFQILDQLSYLSRDDLGMDHIVLCLIA